MRKVRTDWIVDHYTALASMGPQHESCGKLSFVLADRATWSLQWGRNMRVAERLSPATQNTLRRSFNGAAT